MGFWFSQPARSRRAMVVTADSLASDAGVDALKRGGTAADAAVAAGLVLCVTQPGMCGVGGGGHAIIRRSGGAAVCIDFRERAPAAACRDLFRGGASSTTGWLAAAVPGTIRGFEALHGEFGCLPWRSLFEYAIAAAEGHAVSYLRAAALRDAAHLAVDPESSRILLRSGNFFQQGDILEQPELARSLMRIAENGPDEFYTGTTASRLAAEMHGHGGLITATGLAAYRPARRPVLQGAYHGCEILTSPPPSYGGLGLLQMLGILDGSPYASEGHNSARVLHWLAEAMRRSFADRSRFAGDPDFVDVPVAQLLDPGYLAERRASIEPDRATPSAAIGPAATAVIEPAHTTHYTVLDAEGNVVAVTFTLNRIYGSGVTVPDLGFLLNNNMDNFAARPDEPNQYGLMQGEANAIAPGKMPVSSMTPVVVLRGGELYLAGGTPGGPTIPTAMLQALLNAIDFGMNAQDAVAAPRIHHQWLPDILYVEPGFSPDTLRLVEARGHRIETRLSNNDMNLIRITEDGIEGGVDPRREGKATGL